MKDNQVVSFDVYDTLIERILPEEKIYKILSIKYNITNFVKIRLEAEETAKKSFHIYTINDIYKYIDLKNKNDILNDEIELEIKNTKVNVIGKKLYDKYKDNSYLVCTSDMFFSSDIIERILVKNGYDKIQKIFVSCDYKASKKDRKLFKILKSEFHNKSVIHIGDSIRSDYLNSILCGIKPVFINKNKKNICAAKLTKNEYLEKIGYYVFGPMIFEFCLWLNDKKNNNILFLSREGDLICDCYNKMFEVNEKVFYVSRKSVLGGIMYFLVNENKLYDVIKLLRKTRNEKIIDLLKRMNLFKMNDILTNDFINQEVNDKNIDTLIKIIYDNKDIVLQSLKNDYINFDKYVSSLITEDTTLIDVGWNGSMQKLLKLYFNLKNIKIEGLYLGCMNSNDKDGYLFNESNDTGLTILNYSGILELIFMPDYGSIIGYKNENNEIVPLHEKYEFSAETKKDILSIQNGYMKYIEDRKKIGLVSLYDKTEIVNIVNELGVNPNNYDIKYFGSIEFYDNGKFEKLLNYNDGFIKGFKKSEWKIAYLKKKFKIPLPYNRFLIHIRRSLNK